MADSSVETIVVEHRDRFARFGAECVEAALSAPKPAIRLRVPPRAATKRLSTSWVETSPRLTRHLRQPRPPGARIHPEIRIVCSLGR